MSKDPIEFVARVFCGKVSLMSICDTFGRSFRITFLIFGTLSLSSFAQTEGSFYEPVRKCQGTITRITTDTLFITFPDSCTSAIFDTSFNGTYVFVKIPSNRIDRIVTFKNKKPHGREIEYHLNGKVRIQGQNKNSKMVGEWIEYYKTGEIKSIFYCKRGEVKKQRCFDLNGNRRDCLSIYFGESLEK